MTQEKIIEGNRLISEFMEYDDVDCCRCKNNYDCNHLQCGLTNNEKWELLGYNDNWDWLIPVWFKCQRWYVREFGLLTSTFELSSIGIIIKANYMRAFHWASTFSPDGDYDEKKLIWEAIVNFIKWHKDYVKNI